MTLVPVFSSPNRTKFCLGAFLLLCLVQSYIKLLVRTRTQDRFRCCGVCFYNLLFEANNFGLGAVILACLVSELHKTSSLGLEPRNIFRGFSICFCNLLFETNKFVQGAILLSCLVALSGNRTQDTFFRSFDPSMFSSCCQEISMTSLVQIGVSFLEL
jgi:hypothetical protein